jgi:hypothetical protein
MHPPARTPVNDDPELLVGLSFEELEALADSLLAPSAQTRLDELLERQKQKQLSVHEEKDLDGLLRRIDYLTVLKTRARYTLNRESTTTTGS